MQESKPNEVVRNTINAILCRLGSSLETSSTKAMLAKLRNSVGRPYIDCIEVWALIFESVPSKYLGKGSKLSEVEGAIINALQLYSIHQQGNKKTNVNINYSANRWRNIGYSLSFLRKIEKDMAKEKMGSESNSIKENMASESVESKISPVDRRFNTMISASSLDGLCYHLRQMIKLLKSRIQSEEYVIQTKIDYVLLAEDFYWFAMGYKDNLRLDWARQYYRIIGDEKNEDK